MSMKKRNITVSLTGFWFFIVLCFHWLLLSSSAHSISPEDVPDPLKPWINWVLDDEKSRDCPWLYHNDEERRCAWPTILELDLSKTMGRFRQTWQVYAQSVVWLPGNSDLWPQKVLIDGKPALVIGDGDQPGARLTPGRHLVEGEFLWSALPEVLAIPENTGLIFLTINGKRIHFPDIDPGGRLLLKNPEASPSARENREDQLEVVVFRRIVDQIPMELLTRIELKAAGREREIFLGPVLPKGFIPLNLVSPLPARLDSDGRLRLKIRAGNWTIEVYARNTADLTSLTAAAIPGPWPKEEVWGFEAKNQFRLVEVKGLLSIDPRQTAMPDNWKNLPAYRVLPGDVLKLHVVRRGDPDPAPDQLYLERNLWLDFAGTGYTFQDHITGTMTRGWRLEMNPEIRLGRAVIDDIPQFITQMENTEKQGVEVRRGTLNLIADSRYENRIGALPATGWDHDFTQVGATLHLPPGWELISVRGVDFAEGTWLAQWTLMDIFLVLIIAVSFLKLWHWQWGACALIAMTLIWQEPHAPHYVWLNILAAVALLRVLPEGRFARAAMFYRNMGLIALVLIGVPFMVVQVRSALFPQLENPFMPIAAPMTQSLSERASGEGDAVMEKAKQPMLSDMRSMKRAPSSQGSDFSNLSDDQGIAPIKALDQIDPDAIVQTGPGIPQWQWRSIPLKWNGPVKRLQRMHLVLLSPKITLLVHFLSVFMLLAVSLKLYKTAFHMKWPHFLNINRHTAAFLMIIGVMIASPQGVKADFPGPDLLQELKTKLLHPPDCLPNCAQIPRMALDIDENVLVIRMEIHALGSVAIPLPGKADQWLPDRVTDNGIDAKGLYRSENGELWIQLDEGIHQVVLTGPLPMRDSVQLPLPLKPRHVAYAAKKWIVRGISENGIADDQLQIERGRGAAEKKAESPLEPNVFMPFVRIERNLRLGLDWRVETRVIRASPQKTAVVIEVPLLPGESVTTAGFSVKGGNVLVNMGPDQQSLAWRSALKKQPELTLTAPQTLSWVEVWRADVSTLWHAEASGLNVVAHQDPLGQWFPEWRPWPGETLTLRTFRPKGAKGQTMTIDNSRIDVTPGSRAVDACLTFTLNSSQGAQHTLRLPEKTELQSVAIDGLTQPVRQKGRDVTFPVVPGKQSVAVSFRSLEGISSWFKTPAVELGMPGTNHSIHVDSGTGRWILWTTGPRMGPAVLFWGVLIVILIIAALLGRAEQLPLRTWQWFLLGIGLSQTSVWLGLIVVGWIFALAARKNINPDREARSFNLIQLGLGILTAGALTALFFAVQKGLLGLPEMQISGNRSTAFALNWFSDRVGMTLPRASIVSLPLPAYRVFMLLWALWLALSLVGWLRWAWQCFATNGIWRNMPLLKKKTGRKTNPAAGDSVDTKYPHEA
jgi:hypothetical protein